MNLIEIGKLGRPHGLKGELYLDRCTLTPLELHELKTFTWRSERGASRTVTLTTARRANQRMLVRFAEVGDRDVAATYTNGRLLTEPKRLPDPGPDATYTFQLVGLDVVTEDGGPVGQVAEVWPTPANPVLVVRGRGEVLIPAVPDFVKTVDLEARRIVVRLLPGMESEGGAAAAADEEPAPEE
ncbi:MAG: 16S rRNA processing protein RimM [Candidatus Eisenbacteria bacterium]|nr:16S rRNA processing protein RimM [Candidatus Eisenbacteria bacterium]